MLGGAAVLPVLRLRDAHPQSRKRLPRIGMLVAWPEGDSEGQRNLAAFRQALLDAGWTEGEGVEIAYRWAGTDVERTRTFAKELVALQPDLIVSSSTSTTAALARETTSIPIVFAVMVDPVGSGFVTTMARPGGNVTGFTNLDPRMAGKWLELLKEIAPGVVRVAIPFNPATEPYSELYLSAFSAAAPPLGMEVIAKPVHGPAELEAFISAAALERKIGLIPMPGPFSVTHREQITSLAARHRLPAIYWGRAFAVSGGLLSYGNDNADNWRRAAIYADRILKGEKPGELPVQFPVKFDLVVNVKAANALGLAIPPTLLERADETIE
jgi:putative ABC transport system substrate-binding protein